MVATVVLSSFRPVQYYYCITQAHPRLTSVFGATALVDVGVDVVARTGPPLDEVAIPFFFICSVAFSFGFALGFTETLTGVGCVLKTGI